MLTDAHLYKVIYHLRVLSKRTVLWLQNIYKLLFPLIFIIAVN